jgi:hypothetical protein
MLALVTELNVPSKMQDYTTSDIQLAALLYAEGVPFLGIDNTNPRRKGFIFKDEQRIADLVQGFWQETNKINPRKYMGAYKELKNRLFE